MKLASPENASSPKRITASHFVSAKKNSDLPHFFNCRITHIMRHYEAWNFSPCLGNPVFATQMVPIQRFQRVAALARELQLHRP